MDIIPLDSASQAGRARARGDRPGPLSKDQDAARHPAGLPDGRVVTIPMSSVDLSDQELEFRVDHKTKDLVDDIRRNGQQFPVILRPKNRGFQIVSGFRRCRALRSLQWPTVKAIVRHDLDDDQAFRISFLENERRKGLTGLDKANAIAKLKARGKTDAEIQDIYGIGYRQLKRYQQVTTFPPPLARAVGDGSLKTTHGLALMRAQIASGGTLDLERWIHRTVTERLSVRKLTLRLNAAVGRPNKRTRYMERDASGGFRLYPMRYRPGETPEQTRNAMIERLRKALELLERTT